MTERTRMFSVQPGTPGRRQQKPRTIRSIGHAGLRRRHERAADREVLELVHLGDDPRGPARAGMLDLAADQLQEALPHVHRRDEQLVEAGRDASGR